MSVEEKTEKLCAGFFQLDEKEQEHILGVLEALLFAKEKAETDMLADTPKPTDKNEGLA